MSFGIYHAFQHDLCDINSFIDFASSSEKALCSPTRDGKIILSIDLEPRVAINKAGEHFMKIVLLCI
jgi:hypothetical protein